MELERTFDETSIRMSMTVLYFLSLCVILKRTLISNNKNNSTSFEDMVAQIKGRTLSVALFIDGKKIETVSY